MAETVEDMLGAGIKVWMLTGDKMETAANIALSCKIFSAGTQLMRIEGEVREEIEEGIRGLDRASADRGDKGLLIDGCSLGMILADERLKGLFLEQTR